MTLKEKYPETFKFLATCNGTGKLEIEKIIASGKIEAHEAQLLYLQVCLEEMNKHLDDMNKKAEDL
jgi:hypothetical protein